MLVLSDTNILSSLAAGNGFHLLEALFPKTMIYIPPAVEKELQIGLARGKTHLDIILQAIDSDDLQVLELSHKEKRIAQTLPKKLNHGECEAIALAQNQKGRLLSNDKRAVRYCQKKGIKVLNLPNLLRLLWKSGIISQDEVRLLLKTMKDVENLILSKKTLDEIFAPISLRRRRRRKP
jgi:predicted nucleic acid-binding protein